MDTLNNDCICNILSYFDMEENVKLMPVNKTINKVAKSNKMWKQYFKNNFNKRSYFRYKPNYYLSFKIAHKKKIEYEKRFRESFGKNY